MSRADVVFELLGIWERGIEMAEANGCPEGAAALKIAVQILLSTYDRGEICQRLAAPMTVN